MTGRHQNQRPSQEQSWAGIPTAPAGLPAPPHWPPQQRVTPSPGRSPSGYRWQDHLTIDKPARRYPADRTWSDKGWPRVADDLWRIMHSDRTGARRADTHIVALGLGAGLLIELIVAGQVVLHDDLIKLSDPVVKIIALRRALSQSAKRPARWDPLLPDSTAEDLLWIIESEPQPLRLADWLAYLARAAPQQVARRLIEAGHLTADAHRGLFHRTPTYQPVDANLAIWPMVRLQMPLRGQDLGQLDVVLLGLCRATGLYRWVYAGQPGHVVDELCRRPDRLPQPYPQFWAQLESAIATSAARLR